MRIGVGLALVTACTSAGTEPATIATTFDACAPLALVADAATAEQSAGLAAAQDLWRDRGAPALGRRAGSTLEVRFDDAADAFHGQYDDAAGVIYINRGITDEATLAIVIAHELGHAFGLVHVPREQRSSVMNPGNLTVTPTAADQAAVAALWGSCD